MESHEQDGEGEEIERRGQAAHDRRIAHDAAHVPMLWLGQFGRLNGVEWDADLGEVVEQVVEEDLSGQQRQEGQEQRGHGHR
jgi:hypothetical protein